MIKKHLTQIMVLLGFLVCTACQPVRPLFTKPAAATDSPIPIDSTAFLEWKPTTAPSAAPTETNVPNSSAISNPTTFPINLYGVFDPQDSSWWLVMANHRFVLLNADGSGEKVLLDGDFSSTYYNMAVTPPGQGAKAALVTAANTEQPDGSIPIPLQMHLSILQLPEGQVLKELDLIDPLKTPDLMTGPHFLFAVIYSTPTWSPDGRYLAFVAALDGPDADVYLYDSQTGTIQRASQEPDSPTDLSWSPDGGWLVYQQVVAFGGGGSDMKGLWAIDLQEISARKLVDTCQQIFDGWTPDGRLISHAFDGFTRTDCPTAQGLQLIDPASGQIQPLLVKEQLPGAFIAPAYQPGSQWIAVMVHYPHPEPPEPYSEQWLNKDALPGSVEVFALPMNGGQPKSLMRESNHLGWGIDVVPAGVPDCWLANYEHNIYRLTPDGYPSKYTQASETLSRPRPSPEGSWIAVADDTQNPENTNVIGLRLVSADNQTAWVVTNDPVFPYSVYWLPDSKSVLYWTAGQLYFYKLGDKLPRLVREVGADRMIPVQP